MKSLLNQSRLKGFAALNHNQLSQVNLFQYGQLLFDSLDPIDIGLLKRFHLQIVRHQPDRVIAPNNQCLMRRSAPPTPADNERQCLQIKQDKTRISSLEASHTVNRIRDIPKFTMSKDWHQKYLQIIYTRNQVSRFCHEFYNFSKFVDIWKLEQMLNSLFVTCFCLFLT